MGEGNGTWCQGSAPLPSWCDTYDLARNQWEYGGAYLDIACAADAANSVTMTTHSWLVYTHEARHGIGQESCAYTRVTKTPDGSMLREAVGTWYRGNFEGGFEEMQGQFASCEAAGPGVGSGTAQTGRVCARGRTCSRPSSTHAPSSHAQAHRRFKRRRCTLRPNRSGSCPT